MELAQFEATHAGFREQLAAKDRLLSDLRVEADRRRQETKSQTVKLREAEQHYEERFKVSSDGRILDSLMPNSPSPVHLSTGLLQTPETPPGV